MTVNKIKTKYFNMSGEIEMELEPKRYDFKEDAKLTKSHILDKKVWVPSVPVPYPLEISDSVRFKHVSCGSHHTVAVTLNGDVYACGLASNGRLGIESDKVSNIFELTRVPLVDFKIASAHCGSNFTLLLTMKGQVLSAGFG